MSTPSNAEQFFREIMSADSRIEFLRSLKDESEPSFESEWFDCKQAPDKEEKTKAIWCEAIGGFANTGGGVLIWGLVAKKDPNGIDRVFDEKPVDNPMQFKSRLTELARQATNPPLSGIEIEAVSIPERPEKGFVVCLVPEGRFKPYRSEIKGGPQWFHRAGDQFVVISPAMLRLLFYPQISTNYEVDVELSWSWDSIKKNYELRLESRVRNTGTATARDLTIKIKNESEFRLGRNCVDPEEWSIIESAFGADFVANSNRALHPGEVRRLLCVDWTGASLDFGNFGTLSRSLFQFDIYSTDQPRQLYRAEIRDLYHPDRNCIVRAERIAESAE